MVHISCLTIPFLHPLSFLSFTSLTPPCWFMMSKCHMSLSCQALCELVCVLIEITFVLIYFINFSLILKAVITSSNMYNKCCVVSCSSRRKDVSLHKFPKSEIGLQKWLQCINCEKLQGLSFRELRKQFVCRNHFEKRFLASKRDRARLRANAYPTLFSACEISSGIPQTAAAIPTKSGKCYIIVLL